MESDIVELVPKKDVDEAFYGGLWLGMLLSMIGFYGGIALVKLLS